MSASRELADLVSESPSTDLNLDNNTLFVDVSENRVGIGTTTPGFTLDVQGTLTVGVDDTGHDVKFFGDTSGKYWMWDTSADGTVQVGNSQLTGAFTVGVDDAGHDVKFFGPTSGAYMEWEGENNDRLVLMGATTKLGINEATPALPLHISHSSTNTSVDDNSSSHSAIMLQNTSNTDGNYTGIWNRDADNDATNAAIIFKNVSQSNSTSSMHFLTRASGAGAAVKMMIDADGKVGIGTTAPSTKLDFGLTSAGDNIITLRKNSNSVIGIGAGTGYGVKVFAPSDGTASDLMFETGLISTGDGTTFTQTGLAVRFDGKVGIGLTAPSQNLDVLTSAQITGAEGTSAMLFLVADEGDDNGDGWRIASHQLTNNLTIANDTSGSYVDKLTIATDGTVTTPGTVYADKFYIEAVSNNPSVKLYNQAINAVSSGSSFGRMEIKSYSTHGYKNQIVLGQIIDVSAGTADGVIYVYNNEGNASTYYAHNGVNGSSDERTKTNIKELAPQLNENTPAIKKYVQYGKKRVGVVAQDIEKIRADWVESTITIRDTTEEFEGGFEDQRYVNNEMILYNYIAELTKEVLALKSELAELK